MEGFLGLENGLVRLVPYTQAWPARFSQEKVRLAAALGSLALDIQHIGSTAVPGMIAKPIIDIGVAVENFEQASSCIAPVEQLGYHYRGENGIPRRHYFVWGDPVAFHLHVLEQSSLDWRNHLAFRDALRANADLAREYVRVKSTLAQQFPTDREAYTDGKGVFIQRVLESTRKNNLLG